jgi:small subunit ribosomal protein S17
MSNTQTQQSDKKSPKIKGVVVSTKMAQTIVVEVETLKTHPKYLKKYRATKRYKVHAPDQTYQVGQVVWFQACRPVSRGKRHSVVVA